MAATKNRGAFPFTDRQPEYSGGAACWYEVSVQQLQ